MGMTNQPRIAVVLDCVTSALRSPAQELLTLARELGPVVAIAFDEPSDEVSAELGLFGVAEVAIVDLPQDEQFFSPVVATALTDAVNKVDASVVLMTSSFVNREIAALTARALGAGLTLDALPVGFTDAGQLRTEKLVFAGTWDVAGHMTTPKAVVTVRPNAVIAAPSGEPTQPSMTRWAAAPSASDTLVSLTGRELHEVSGDSRPALAEAAVVVAGGRGTLGDFAPVEDLADALGAAIGATRDAVDEGWVDHDAQVGQTGVTIAPRVYIGVGISGAPHHRGGMQASGTIIAVNSDPEAPLLEIADFAVIGDLAEVLPQAAAAIRAHRGI